MQLAHALLVQAWVVLVTATTLMVFFLPWRISTEKVIRTALNLYLAFPDYLHRMFLSLLCQSLLSQLMKQFLKKLDLARIMINIINQSIFVMIPEVLQIKKAMRKAFKSYNQSLLLAYQIVVFAFHSLEESQSPNEQSIIT